MKTKVGGSEAHEFDRSVAAVKTGTDASDEATRLYDCLSDKERLWLLDGDVPFWVGGMATLRKGYNHVPYVHGAVRRLGIPGIRFVDGPRGCVTGNGTAFPVPMARGATWDPELEERIGDVIGREVRAAGGNFFGGVCINLPRHPAWGRAQETYGDEPYHLGEFGAALTRGVQRHAMACVKHFALNSMENARFQVDVKIADADLHDMYLPHFERVAAERVAGVMTSYNAVNGEWAGQNRYLLTTVLRELWKWDGVSVSDFVWGLRDAGKSLEAGLDLEEPFRQQRARQLKRQLKSGEVSWDAVRRSGERLLAAQLRSYAARPDIAHSASLVADAEARELARDVASRAMVLLKNDPVEGRQVLPLDPDAIRSIAVIGRLADRPNMGDEGSSNVRTKTHVTPFQGIVAAFPNARIVLVTDDDPTKAATAAADVDVAIIIAGYDKHDEGEYFVPGTMDDAVLGALLPPKPWWLKLLMKVPTRKKKRTAYGGDRTSLTLRSIDEAIIAAVSAANARTVVAIVAAGAVITENWRDKTHAILMMWYAGMEGGHALGDVLSGRREPAGRLPYSIPMSAKHLPAYDRNAEHITYDRFHGQRLLDKLDVAAAYPHGFGLGYAQWSIDAASVGPWHDGAATLSASVTNRGLRAGCHVIQVYGYSLDGDYKHQIMLVGFKSIEVDAGETVEFDLLLSLRPLAVWNAAERIRIAPDLSSVVLEIGSHARDQSALQIMAA